MEEIWKDIQGYEGLYQVSNLGRVKSLGRSGKGCSLGDRVLKPMINDDGYELVNLKSSNHIAKWHSVHRLVAIHFIPNPNDYKEINHKDEIKMNGVQENTMLDMELLKRDSLLIKEDNQIAGLINLFYNIA